MLAATACTIIWEKAISLAGLYGWAVEKREPAKRRKRLQQELAFGLGLGGRVIVFVAISGFED